MRRISLITATGFLLLGVLCVAPRPAQADAVEDIAKVVDKIPGVPVTGQDIRASRDLFACIDNPPDNLGIPGCIDKFNNTPLGQKALGLPSWFHTLINVYIDIREGDFLGLVRDAGFTIACAIANVVFAVDVCGIAQAILEALGTAKELLSDVVGFIKDLGGEILDFLGLGGSDGPPLWQVIFNGDLKPHLGEYAEDWLERPSKFKVEFDVTGHQAQSLVCAISQKRFGKPCAWLFGTGNTQYDAMFVPLFRGDTIKAIQMAQAAAIAQAVATVGKRAKEWLEFRHDWLTDRAPADRLRKAYGVWGPTVIRVNCLAAAKPWKEFLEEVNQTEVKPETEKVLNKLSGWSSQTTMQFCTAYEAGLKAEKLAGCAVVGMPTEKALKLDCNPGSSFTTCGSSAKAADSTKFPPALDLECKTHALKKDSYQPPLQMPPPKLGPTAVQPIELPKGVSPR